MPWDISWHFFLYLAMQKIILNGELLECSSPILHFDNRSFKYGDGFFETMRIIDGKIMLEHFHEERFIKSIACLKFKSPSGFQFEEIKKNIIALCAANDCLQSARVRLTVFRGNGEFISTNNYCEYLIEASLLNDASYTYNLKGLTVCLFKDAKISCDYFSNLKSANYLPYIMASIYAQEQKKDEALLLNIHNRVVESSIANVFWVKDGVVFTPPLTEGCVDGVMRKYLIESISSLNRELIEKPFFQTDLLASDELFLTNAIKGIRWVGQFHEKKFANTISSNLYKQFITTIHC